MQRVAVIMGGISAEREVSLATGKACAEALENCGYQVSCIDASTDLAQKLAENKPDVVFNALHGGWGENGAVQGMLEIMNIPYTHSGVMASALAMNKPEAKIIFRSAGIPVPESAVMTRRELAASSSWAAPIVIKPLNEGSSVGVEVIMGDENPGTSDATDPDEIIMVERYIPGHEIQVAVMNDRALGAIEIIIPDGIFDTKAKYAPSTSDRAPCHIIPAPILHRDYQLALEYALLAHKVLGCRGLTRSDLRYDDTGRGPASLYLLEVNTQPGMTPTSLAPEIAAHSGVSFEELCSQLVDDAFCYR